MDEAGVQRAHIVGNSLGGYLALVLAARGRAESVVALAPAGGGDHTETLALQERLAGVAGVPGTGRARVPLPVEITPAVARRATALLTVRYEHLPPEVISSLVAAPPPATPRRCSPTPASTAGRWTPRRSAARCGSLWGLEDQLLPWPAAAEGYRRSLDAEWVELDGVGHAPQLDIPLETAQLDLWASRPRGSRRATGLRRRPSRGSRRPRGRARPPASAARSPSRRSPSRRARPRGSPAAACRRPAGRACRAGRRRRGRPAARRARPRRCAPGRRARCRRARKARRPRGA